MAKRFSVESVFKAIDKVSAPMKKMGKATVSFGKRTANAMKRATLATNRYRKANSGMMRNIGMLVGAGGLMFLLAGGLRTVAEANIMVDKSMASLQAITGVTDEAFASFETQVNDVSKAQLQFAGDTAKAFEVVASAQPELLKNADALGRVTNAAITLSKASGDELEVSALSLTGVMNQFSLSAEHAERVMNTLAAGSVAGSANITNVAAAMKNFGAVAAGANVSVEKAVALVEVMGSKSIFAEEAGTALRATILRLQKAGLGYESGLFDINDALEAARKKSDSFATALERDAYLQNVFGARQITTGQILLNNIGKFENLTEAVTGTNTAVEQMNTKANTLSNRLLEVSAAFKNATTSTDSQNKNLQSLKDLLALVANNMDKIIALVIVAAKLFLLWGSYIIAVNVAMTTMTALLAIGKFLKFIRIIAMMTKAKGAWVAVQWALNVAMAANPVGLIIAGIIALIAVVVLLVRNWDKVKAVMGTVWDGMKKALSFIGRLIFEYLIFPIRMLLLLISKIPGKVGNFAEGALGKIDNIRIGIDKFGDDDAPEDATENRTEIISREAVFQRRQIEQQQQGFVNLNINNQNNSDLGVETAGVPIKLNGTGMFK